MDIAIVIAIVGLVLTCLNNFPQIYTTFHTQQTADINFTALILRRLSQVAFIIYAIKLNDSLMLTSLSISNLSTCVLLLFKLRNLNYKRHG